MKLVVILSIFAITIGGCTTSATKATKEYKFVLPDIPTLITSPEGRADYLVKNYWKNFDFKDTALISREEITEQAFVDFISILNHVPISVTRSGIHNLVEGAYADSVMFDHFNSLFEKYLYDPNSPFRNEDYYIAVLEEVIPKMNEYDRIRPEYLLSMAYRNRVGMVATPFPQLNKASGDPILLFFQDPECPTCKQIKEHIKNSGLDQRVTVVLVNPDECEGLDKLYDLKALPSLYLLDREKVVLLKDATIEQVDAYMSQNR